MADAARFGFERWIEMNRACSSVRAALTGGRDESKVREDRREKNEMNWVGYRKPQEERSLLALRDCFVTGALLLSRRRWRWLRTSSQWTRRWTATPGSAPRWSYTSAFIVWSLSGVSKVWADCCTEHRVGEKRSAWLTRDTHMSITVFKKLQAQPCRKR